MNNSAEPASIQEFLERDHNRLDILLAQALSDDGTIDQSSFDEFRKGLLKHIGIEEKLIFLFVTKLGSPEQREIAATLRIQHGAIASLLVLDPSPQSIRALRVILAVHNPIEEGGAGFYAACELLASDQAPLLLEQMESIPEVPVAIRAQTSQIVESAKRSMVRAGFPASLLE